MKASDHAPPEGRLRVGAALGQIIAAWRDGQHKDCAEALVGIYHCIVNMEAENERLREACSVFVEWLEREDVGPRYPEGTGRDSEGGEAIWREWYDGNIVLCHQAVTLARAAIKQATGA